MEGSVWHRGASWIVFGLKVQSGCVLEPGVWLRGASWRVLFGLRCALEGGVWLRGASWRWSFGLEVNLAGWCAGVFGTKTIVKATAACPQGMFLAPKP